MFVMQGGVCLKGFLWHIQRDFYFSRNGKQNKNKEQGFRT